MKSFLVAGLFRSGTLFLAQLLNRDPKWTVRQEAKIDNGVKALQRRLSKNYYGEVNMYATRHINEITVKRSAIIVRDIDKVMLSYFNKRWRSEVKRVGKQKALKFMQDTIDEVNIKINAMDMALEHGTRCIQFTKMTTDLGYIKDLAKYLGVNNVPWDGVDVTHKVNAREVHFHSLGETPAWFQSAVKDMRWFTDKWVK